MNFFKKLSRILTGGTQLSGDIGLYYYAQCHRCQEVIRVRINPMNDLSQKDDGHGYFARKVVVGQRCYNRVEIEFEYDPNRNLIGNEVSGGKLVDKAAYEADQKAHTANS